MSDVLEFATQQMTDGIDLCLVTVVETTGSVPAPVGARMAVLVEEIRGTVGGGALEKFAIERARELLAGEGGPQLVQAQTGELGMTCGGQATLFLEPHRGAPGLWVFGAGHIAAALAPMAVSLGFRVTVADGRPEFARGDRFPPAVRARLGDPAALAREVPDGAHALIVTHGHVHDQAVLEVLADRDPALPYIGMIGSVRKVRGALEALAKKGIQPGPNLYAPVGLDLGGGSPAEIALAVSAELLGLRHGRQGLPHCRSRLDK